MTPSEAAHVIGCTPAHVRLLIRRKLLRARKRTSRSPRGFKIHEYNITQSEAERYSRQRRSVGRPRGSTTHG